MKRITRRKVIRKYYMHDSFDDCEIDLWLWEINNFIHKIIWIVIFLWRLIKIIEINWIYKNRLENLTINAHVSTI